MGLQKLLTQPGDETTVTKTQGGYSGGPGSASRQGHGHDPDLLTPKPLPSSSLKILTISATREQTGRPACYLAFAPPRLMSPWMWSLTPGDLPCPRTHCPLSPHPHPASWPIFVVTRPSAPHRLSSAHRKGEVTALNNTKSWGS